MSKAVTVGATAFLACVLWGTPLSLRLSPEGKVSLSMDGASAQTARMSVPGANRRAHRRAYRRGYYGYGYTVRIAMTIQRTSGSATTDSGGITDTLTNRGGRNKAE